jgi:thymidylate synthase (FAD)
MGTVTILPETTKKPITMIGQMAGVCWGADTSDDEKNYKRGWDCITSGHGRTMEYPDVYMVLDGYSARVIREWYTHIGGMPTRLQASTRYINYDDFGYVVPPSIAKNVSTLCEWQSIMQTISNAMSDFEKAGIPREDIALLLPLGMTTRVVDKRNLRNLIDMSRQRMCNRAYWEFREMFGDIQLALCDYSSEWMALVTTQFKVKCDVLGYCPEKHGCGRWERRDGDETT